jgi:hypothetical protein
MLQDPKKLTGGTRTARRIPLPVMPDDRAPLRTITIAKNNVFGYYLAGPSSLR